MWSLLLRYYDYKVLCLCHLSYACYIYFLAHAPWCDHPNNIWWRQNYESPYYVIFSVIPLGPNIPFSTLISNTSIYVWDTKLHIHTNILSLTKATCAQNWIGLPSLIYTWSSWSRTNLLSRWTWQVQICGQNEIVTLKFVGTNRHIEAHTSLRDIDWLETATESRDRGTTLWEACPLQTAHHNAWQQDKRPLIIKLLSLC
jgi:hypothetical protein